MARLHVVAVNARLPAWAEQACADYAKRMPKGYEVSRLAVKDERKLPKGVRIIAMDERGREMTTRQFAQLLQEPSAFVVGGPDGLSASFKSDADMVIKLSAMTLPHALAQVVLLEQLYRAASLLTNHPYHRE